MRFFCLLKRIFSLRYNIRYRLGGTHIGLMTYLSINETGRLQIGKTSQVKGRVLTIGRKSTLSIGEGALIEGDIRIGDNCQVQIGNNFKLLGKASLTIDNHSFATWGNDCLVESVVPFRNQIRVIFGSFYAGNNSNIRGDIVVQEGNFRMGSNSFINAGSEVRCEESIEIGDYVFISYFVDIHDTNTHSVDWRDRRQEVEDGYPNSTKRGQRKPTTAPVSLGDDVWVGKRAAILKGCHLGARSIVGTRAVVTISCSEDSLLVGNPASIYRLSE